MRSKRGGGGCYSVVEAWRLAGDQAHQYAGAGKDRAPLTSPSTFTASFRDRYKTPYGNLRRHTPPSPLPSQPNGHPWVGFTLLLRCTERFG